MFIAAHNTITSREEELPMRVTSLENTFRDVKRSYQLSLKKTKKKTWHIDSYGSYGLLILQLSPRVLLVSKDWQHIKTLSYFAAFCGIACSPCSAQLNSVRNFPSWIYMDIIITGGISCWHKNIFILSVPDFFENAPSCCSKFPLIIIHGSLMVWAQPKLYSGKYLGMSGRVCGLYFSAGY